MSYRNDHEAALARVAALEAENAKLVEENRLLRDRDPERNFVASPATSIALLVFTGLVLVFAFAMTF